MTRATYAHPVALAALALLLVNDHVLKARFPGTVTGKLSDVAGPVVLAALLGPVAARLARRPWAEAAAWWAVAVAFAAVKVVPVVNAAAVAVLSALAGPSAIARDPADVLGLLALPLAWRLTRSAPERTPRVLRAVAFVVGAGAVTATSYAPEPRVVSLKVDGDAVVAVVDDYDDTAWRSADGRTWRAARSPSALTEPALACHERHCYRVTPAGAVEESADGGVTWRETVPTTTNGWVRPSAVVFVPGRDVAVVAVGEDGVLRRDGTGEWERVAVGPSRPGVQPRSLLPPLPEPGPYLVAVLLGLVGVVVVTIVMVVVSMRRRPSAPPPGAWPFDGPLPPLAPPPPPPRRPGRYRR